MRHLTSADYRRMPWRNGGGTTTEIAIAAGPSERFLHRVSIADVEADGPFSRFEGYDRHIMLISGAGMTLECGAHGRIELRAPFEPRFFSGDWDVTGMLVSGPVRDFNVIVDRARVTATLETRRLDERATIACGEGSSCLVHVLEGNLMGVAEGDTLVADVSFVVVPDGIARVAIVSLCLVR